MAVAFQREAEALLKNGGYSFVRKTGKQHTVWKHPDKARPPIVIPGTPENADHALVHIRRAVRVGSSTHIPQGLEADMTKSHHRPPVQERPLRELLAAHASSDLQRRATVAAGGDKPGYASHEAVAKWLRKCLTSHGSIPNAELNGAAETLALTSSHLSTARVSVGAVSYRNRDKAGPGDPSFTDFAHRAPKDAVVLGRAAGSKNGASKRPPEPVKTSFVAPVDPDEVRGRRLDQLGLTDDQHAAAERQMRESTERADREAAEIRARLAAGFASGDKEVAVSPVAETNGNGRQKSQLEVALEMMKEAALADTHALTDEDIMLLRGHQDTLKRLQSDLAGMAASIGSILRRVDTRTTAA